MPPLEPADKVEIRILVDNATDMLSSNPPFVESESACLTRRGFKTSASRCLCCAVHGLSCLVTVQRGGKSHTVLFDTGPEDYAFERNVTRLGADLGIVEHVVAVAVMVELLAQFGGPLGGVRRRVPASLLLGRGHAPPTSSAAVSISRPRS